MERSLRAQKNILALAHETSCGQNLVGLPWYSFRAIEFRVLYSRLTLPHSEMFRDVRTNPSTEQPGQGAPGLASHGTMSPPIIGHRVYKTIVMFIVEATRPARGENLDGH